MANMSGTYKGLQACIKEINPIKDKAYHVLHTLGVNSANYCFEMEVFFLLFRLFLRLHQNYRPDGI